MAKEEFANTAQTTLAAAIDSSVTSFSVTGAAGFPAANFRIKIDEEIMLVTSKGAGTNWTVQARGDEGTTATAHDNCALVTHVLTAGALQSLDAGYVATGQLALARGGTGADLSTLAANHVVGVNNAASSWEYKQLVAGSGISVSNGAGSITITNTSPSSGGTVTGVTAGTGLSGGTITGSGTIDLATPVTVPNGGTGQTSLTNHGLLVGQGAAAVAMLAAGASGQVLIGSSGNDPAWLAAGGSGQVLMSNGASDPSWATVSGTGTVTSVWLTMPAEFSVTNSPVTAAGTLAVSKANQNANLVYAGPSSGAAAAPTFRALVLDDMPAVVQSGIGRNVVINGNFDIWQRGTSFAAVANAAYTADRWEYRKSGAMVHTVARDTSAPAVSSTTRLSNYSLLVDCTTVDSSIAAGDFCLMQTKIEGYNWAQLAQRQCTVSFWVKATQTGTYCVSLRNAGSGGTPDRSYVAEYTVSASDTWEKKTVTFSASPSAGTWDYTNGVGVLLSWTLAGGSTYQTTAGSWATGNYYSTSNQVNACGSTSNNFYLSQVQLEVGDTASQFEYRPFGAELALCQRYYEVDVYLASPDAYCTNQVLATFTYTVEKRAIPTATIVTNFSLVNVVGQPGINTNSTSAYTLQVAISAAGRALFYGGDIAFSAEL